MLREKKTHLNSSFKTARSKKNCALRQRSFIPKSPSPPVLYYLGKQFHLEDGVFYDTQCFRKLNAIECDQCHDLIEGVDIKYITYNGKFIHHRCFFCTECRKQLSTAEKFRDVKTTVKGALICLPCSQIDPSTNRKTSVTNYIRKL